MNLHQNYKISVVSIFHQEISMEITTVKNIAHWTKSGTLYYARINR